MPYVNGKITIVLCLALLLLSVAIILLVYGKLGLGWDFTDIYLTGRSFVNPSLFQQHLPVNTTVIYYYKGVAYTSNPYFYITPSHVYISIVREPLVPLFLALTTLASSAYAVQIYLVLLLAMLLAAAFYTARQLNLNPLLLSSLLFAPYVLQWTVLYTSQELLSMVFALVAIALLAKKSPLAGVALALVGLSKYPGLILLPMPLLLFELKNIDGSAMRVVKTYALFALTTLPWLLFNLFYFGNPIISYQYSLGEAAANNLAFNYSQLLNALFEFPVVLAYPIIIMAVLLAATRLAGGANRPGDATQQKSKDLGYGLRLKPLNADDGSVKGPGLFSALSAMDYRYKVVLFFILLSALGFVIVYNNVGIPERFGYLLYAGVVILAALYFESIGAGYALIGKFAPYAVCALSLALLAYILFSLAPSHYSGWNIGEGSVYNSTIKDAVANLTSMGLAKCAVISDAWPFLNYYGIVAYQASSPCSTNMSHYPVVMLRNMTVDNDYCGYEIPLNVLIPNNASYIIYAPPANLPLDNGNYLCQNVT